MNRQGDDLNPSLIDIKSKMTRDAVLNRINLGAGRMPPFKDVVKGNEEAMIAFLFQNKDDMKVRNLDAVHNDNYSTQADKDKEQIDTIHGGYVNVTAYRKFQDTKGNLGIKPPWGILNAIDLNTGEYLWKVPVGNYPDLQKEGEPKTGMISMPGPIVTAGGLVFYGGTRDNKFCAFDKDTGELLWEYILPAPVSSIPCTYRINGRQYVAVSVSGNENNPAGYLMAFALPD